ncbi:S53 family peptidase [Legionella micdadei]|uniref:Peptidase S8 and S53 subtilisin kexin sedolisin n=1 Tax=Legionella micdadei TaxID=451 RepID=A0A098GAH2_LEGMI|nr:S53 family peptidase [Legionella micdadei]KTD29065.1 serine protease, subtilase family [Legionella micdadei]NSL17273.1 S8 family serine peptidase [Legionella micdadei]CEG59428.1 Peptidase S8 and S53 subtilisin kexin sedolisin [Legionella micdadei]SCX89607.1 physarolisin II. Serine peptidase. MEROPS family S53 [Legionella micdadei]
MKLRLDKLQLKLLVAPVLLGILSTQAHALPDAPGKVHHPIHYKPHTNHLRPSGLTPNQVRNAYGFNTISAKGKGQVIAIVDAYDNPRIEADLGVFTKHFGLPACTTKNGCFKKIYANGKRPRTDAGWAGEIALDVQWAYAMAPEAKIMLVEAASDSLQDLFKAIQVAVDNGATVVSMSWGGSEFAQQTTLDDVFNNPKVTFFASSGDNGAGTMYPASSPYVVGVGGTTLRIDNHGNYHGETAWSGSGGGVSSVESWPAGQSSLPIPQSNNMRGVPDVAYNADPETGFAVYNSVPSDEGVGWQVVGGTSAGAPQWAAIAAVANSALGTNLGGKFSNLLYTIANPSTGSYIYNFNDVSSGENGDCEYFCAAQDGYDYVTGLGSPELGTLITDLGTYNMLELASAQEKSE